MRITDPIAAIEGDPDFITGDDTCGLEGWNVEIVLFATKNVGV